MNETEFIFWLKGFTDNMGAEMPTREQWDKIRAELALVFNKVTPYRPYSGVVGGQPLVNLTPGFYEHTC